MLGGVEGLLKFEMCICVFVFSTHDPLFSAGTRRQLVVSSSSKVRLCWAAIIV